jgi:exodeoxyribonuclease III
MKIISWNVAGIRSCFKKGLIDFMKKENADIYCFQEVKAQKEELPKELEKLKEYNSFHSFAEKKGYSGVSIYTKINPIKIISRIGNPFFDREGRVIALEFTDFFLINVYFPHSSRKLIRLDFKLKFNSDFLRFCEHLNKIKPLIIASDFNVAHKEIDLKNPKQNEKNAGFTKEERNWFDAFLKEGFIDTFREFNKEGGNYTWWTYRNNARQRNIGWRIDYFIISNSLKNKLKNSIILKDVFGSDHCPIFLEIEI